MNQHDRDNLFQTLGRIEARQLDSSKKLSEVDTRLKNLEGWKIKAIGFASGAAALASLLFPRLSELLKNIVHGQ